MRYIDLRRNKPESYFDVAIKLGCGPNFVRNRYPLFEQMIKDQGTEFWFRFWLTFCLHPDIREVEEFTRGLPIASTSLCQLLHSRFVEAPVDAIIAYCWNTVFEKTTPVGVTEILLSDGLFIDESYQFVVVNFACALGGVFYKWLRAKDVGANRPEYFSVPTEYLNPEYSPGDLEKYLLRHWSTRLVDLLGVSRSQVPWVRRFLLGNQKNISDNKNLLLYGNTDCLQSKTISRRLKIWLFKVKKIRRAIREIDEKQIVVQRRRDKAVPEEVAHNGFTYDSEDFIPCEIQSDLMDQVKERMKRALSRNNSNEVQKMEKAMSRLFGTNKKEKPEWLKWKKSNSHHSLQHLKRSKSHRIKHKPRSKQSVVIDAATNTEFDNYLRDSSTNTDSISALTNSSVHPKLPINAIADFPDYQKDLDHRCASCNAVITGEVKKCPQCVDEKWKHPRRYCNIVCQTKDWFQRHEQEHNMVMQQVLRNSGVYLKNKDVVVRPPRSNSSWSSITLTTGHKTL